MAAGFLVHPRDVINTSQPTSFVLYDEQDVQFPRNVYDETQNDTTSAPNMDNCTQGQNATSGPPERDEFLVKLEVTLLIVIFLLAFLGNAFVLIVLFYRKKKTNRFRLFILHLSLADLLVAFFNVLPQLIWDIKGRFHGGAFLCKSVTYLQLVVIYLSTYMLLATGYDRYRAICHPMKTYRWTFKVAYITIICAWVSAFLLALPQFFIFNYVEVKEGGYDCRSNFSPEWTVQLYATFFACTTCFVPTLILAIMYIKICYTVCRNFNGPDDGARSTSVRYQQVGTVYKFTGTGHISVIGSNDATETVAIRMVEGRRHASLKVISRAKMMTVVLTFVVVVAYVICWAPSVVTQLWWAYDKTAPVNDYWFVLCILLASLNSCCNPWIYVFFSGSLIKQLLPCCRQSATFGKPPVQRKHSFDNVRLPPRQLYTRKMGPTNNGAEAANNRGLGDKKIQAGATQTMKNRGSGSLSTKLTTDSRLQPGDRLGKQHLQCRIDGPNVHWLSRRLVGKEGNGINDNESTRSNKDYRLPLPETKCKCPSV